MQEAFQNVRVIEVGEFISAPWCARVLADQGCDVIKVEAPGGDPLRGYGPFPAGREDDPEASGLFLYVNANKRGITLDIDSLSGRSALRELLKSSDVLIVGIPVRKQEELGLTYESLKEVNPDLIVTSISPFGLSGPYKYRQAEDVTISAASGISIGIGSPAREPLTLPLFQCSFLGGAIAASATLTALIARDDDVCGGQQVEVAVEEVLSSQLTGRTVATFVYGGVTGKRAGLNGNYAAYYPSGTYECKDGQVYLMAPQIEHWIRFVEAMGTPEWSKEPRYRNRRAMAHEYREEADALITPWLLARTKQEILQTALEKKLPFSPILTGTEILASEHLRSRDAFTDYSRHGTGFMAPRPAPRVNDQPFVLRMPAPLLGEHNDEVLAGLVPSGSEKRA